MNYSYVRQKNYDLHRLYWPKEGKYLNVYFHTLKYVRFYGVEGRWIQISYGNPNTIHERSLF